MDKKNSLIKIYENYNKVYLSQNNIIKFFYNENTYTTEKNVYLILNGYKFPFCVKMIQFDDNALSIELEYFQHNDNSHDISFYLDLLKQFDDPNLLREVPNNFYISRDLLSVAKKVKLSNDLFSKIEEIHYSTNPYQEKFVHGDFRLENILENKNQTRIIDYEGSCIGDRNLDYAYLFFSFFGRRQNFHLIDYFGRQQDFDINNFKYYLSFLLLRLLDNPKFKEKEKAFSFLKKVGEIK